MSDHADQKSSKSSQTRDHLANERTFLAWIRTSIGIMAFGFVVEKFSLFIKQIAMLLGKSNLNVLPDSLQGYSSIIGVFLVALGVLICFLAFLQYKTVGKQITEDTYQPPMLLNVILTLSVLLIGIFLAFYLSISI